MSHCPNCWGKRLCLPGFSWCRHCIEALAELRHQEDKRHWEEEAIERERRAAQQEEAGEVL